MSTTITIHDPERGKAIKEMTGEPQSIVISSGDRINIGYADKVVYGGTEDWRLLTFERSNDKQAAIEIAIPESVWQQFIAQHLKGDARLFGMVVAGAPAASSLKAPDQT